MVTVCRPETARPDQLHAARRVDTVAMRVLASNEAGAASEFTVEMATRELLDRIPDLRVAAPHPQLRIQWFHRYLDRLVVTKGV